MDAHTWYHVGQTETINDQKVFYQRAGKGQVVVCIHGFPSSSWDFEAIWEPLTSKFDTIAMDLIGLGKSSKPNQPLTVALQANMIERLLAAKEITAAHLLAHDLGDTVAQELLARQQEGSNTITWHSCVLMNGGIFPETHRPLLIQKLLISPLGSILAPFMSENTFRKNMTRVFSEAHPPSKDFITETWKLIQADGGKKMIPRLIRYMRERVQSRERWVRPLEQKVVPLRLINGVEDPISGAHAADRFEEVVPDADVVRLPTSGHYPHLETPHEVAEAFLEFHSTLHEGQ